MERPKRGLSAFDDIERLELAAGLPLARAAVFIDTLHPIYEGRIYACWV